jgi:hypothetical protein
VIAKKTKAHDAHEQGTALIVAVAFVAVVLAIAGSLLGAAAIRSQASAGRVRLEEAQRAAEGAIGTAMGWIAYDAPPPQMSGVVQSGAGKNLAWAFTVRKNGTLYKVSAAAAAGDVYRLVQVFVEKASALPPVPPGVRGAITSYYGLQMQANLVVSGNNHDIWGNTLAGDPAATYGIDTHDSSSDIINNGNLSGANQPPTGNNATAIAQGELAVGDTNNFPNTPGGVLGMTDAALIAAAQAGGTFFTNQSQFDTWQAGLSGGFVPNSSPIYLNYITAGGSSPLNNLSFNPEKSYVVINHVAAGNPPTEPAPGQPPNGIATTGNVHVNINGILIFDDTKHINGGSTVNGATVSLWGTAGVQNKFGQGGASLNYSAEAIGLALQSAVPALAGAPIPPRTLSVKQTPTADADAYAALALCGVSTAGMPAVNPANSSGWVLP